MTNEEIKKIIDKQTHKAAQIITKEVGENMFEQYQHYEKYKHEPVIVIEQCILERLKQQLAIAVKFIDAYSKYIPKVKTPKDFNTYEAVWFLFRTEADQALQQIKELEK